MREERRREYHSYPREDARDASYLKADEARTRPGSKARLSGSVFRL